MQQVLQCSVIKLLTEEMSLKNGQYLSHVLPQQTDVNVQTQKERSVRKKEILKNREFYACTL